MEDFTSNFNDKTDLFQKYLEYKKEFGDCDFESFCDEICSDWILENASDVVWSKEIEYECYGTEKYNISIWHYQGVYFVSSHPDDDARFEGLFHSYEDALKVATNYLNRATEMGFNIID